MSTNEPFDFDALEDARERYPSAIVELHDGVLVIGPHPDAIAQDTIAVLVTSLLPHIEAGGFWIEGSATVDYDARNSRSYAVALWEINPQHAPVLVIHVMSAHDRLRWARGRVNRALELGVRHGLLIDPASQSVLVFSGVERSEHSNGLPLPELLPDWYLDEVSLFRRRE